MNKKQTLAILFIALAIFFSLTSIIFSVALSEAETLREESLEESASLSSGVIQLIVESPRKGGESNEERYKR